MKTITSKCAGLISAGFVLAAASSSPAAISMVDFENSPALSTGPSIYVAVPGPQTLTTPSAAFSGGVVLGFATFFPAIAFATKPNVYGTADFGNHLPQSLTIDVNPAAPATEMSFALFNGEVFNQSYTVNAFNGPNLVATQTLANIAPNFNSGYGLVDLVAPTGITKVAIDPVGAPAAWDFLIDTVGFNQNITTILPPPVVQPAVEPVQGHRHGHGEGEVELVEVNFGDDVNDIRGSVVVVPEPGSIGFAAMGAATLLLRRRRRA